MVSLLPLYHVPVVRGGRGWGGLDLSGIRQDLNGKEILLSRIRDSGLRERAVSAWTGLWRGPPQ